MTKTTELLTLAKGIATAQELGRRYDSTTAMHEIQRQRSRARVADFISVVAGRVSAIPFYARHVPRPLIPGQTTDVTRLSESEDGSYIQLGVGWPVKEPDIVELNQSGLFLLSNGLTYPSWGVQHSVAPSESVESELEPGAYHSVMYHVLYDGQDVEKYALPTAFADDVRAITLAQALVDLHALRPGDALSAQQQNGSF